MKTINEKQFCKDVYDFVKEHIDEVNDSYDYLGFKDSEDMLNQIYTDYIVAKWAFFELMYWGMSINYLAKFSIEDNDDFVIYEFKGHYYKYDYDTFKEVEKKTKLIEVIVWE